MRCPSRGSCREERATRDGRCASNVRLRLLGVEAEAATGRVGAAMRWASLSFMLATVRRFAGLTLNGNGVLTGGVQERADRSVACERVVEVHGGARLKDVHFDGGVCE